MNRKKVYHSLEKPIKPLLSELEESLCIIKQSHHSNESIVNRLQKFTHNEQQLHLYNALQKDMKLINEQLNALLDNLKTVEPPE